MLQNNNICESGVSYTVPPDLLALNKISLYLLLNQKKCVSLQPQININN